MVSPRELPEPQRTALAVAGGAVIAWFGLFAYEFGARFKALPAIPLVGAGAQVAYAVFVLAAIAFFVASDPRSVRTLLGAVLVGIAGAGLLVRDVTLSAGGIGPVSTTTLAFLPLLVGLTLLFSRRRAVRSSLTA